MTGLPGDPAAPGHPLLARDRWTTLEPIIDAALDLPPEQRGPFLEKACAGDRTLREQVARLLEAANRQNTVLDEPATARFPSLLHEGPSSAVPAMLGNRYRIESEIGRGGMATVYLAHDTRHERKVAVKVLAPELSAVVGAERFLAEIRTTAQLHHPHILPLYDSGEADGFLFYVMPYVEGESLRQRMLREHQMPVDDAVRIASEVASALEAAHRQGVIHRDIKPENILLLHGSALVADFGIALAVSAGAPPRLTNPGLTVGTPQYMSPEQASGERAVDPRSDIYSLGAVLYEMLAGEPPFTGATVTAVIAKLIALPAPSVRIVRAAIPEDVDAVLVRALAREPADRYRTAGGFVEALQRIAAATPGRRTALDIASGAENQPHGSRRIVLRRVPLAAIAVTIAGIALASWAWRATNRAAVHPSVRFALTSPGDLRVAPKVLGTSIAISPDGRVIAFVGLGTDGTQQLFVRPLDSLRTRPLQGTEGAVQPFFSPDGSWLGFWADNKLQKVPVNGGTVAALADLPGFDLFGASWSASNVIVVSSGKGLSIIPAAGGAPHRLSQPDSAKGEEEQRWPLVLADGKTVLYTSWGSDSLGGAKIGVLSLETGRSTILDLPGTFPLGVLDGLLVYASASGGELMALPFDVGRRRAIGDPVPVVSDVVVGHQGPAKAGMSRNGSLVYVKGSQLAQIVLANAHHVTVPLITEPRLYSQPRFSPDGKRFAVTITLGTQTDVWIHDVAAGKTTRLTTDGPSNSAPEWTPDGKRVLFLHRIRGERGTLWWQPADLSEPASLLLTLDNADVMAGVISPDGQTLVYETRKHGIWFRGLTGDTSARLIAAASARPAMPRLSPDGRWVAYVSAESGSNQVVVQPFPGPGAPVQVSSEGGVEPIWARDGRRLFYRNKLEFFAATVRTAPTFRLTSRTLLFEGIYTGGSRTGVTDFDASPDGTSFLLLKTFEEPQIIIVHDWLNELRFGLAARVSK